MHDRTAALSAVLLPCGAAACTEELSSTGRPTDTLRNCTKGVDRINKVGDTCSSSCGAGTINVACTALGLWKVDSTCTDMSESFLLSGSWAAN
jgi:hypothetical protein